MTSGSPGRGEAVAPPVTVERARFDRARHVPRLVLWTVLLGMMALLDIWLASRFMEGSETAAWGPLVPLVMLLLVMPLIVWAVRDELEPLLHFTVRLDGGRVIYAWHGARPRTLPLDGRARVEALVAEGAAPTPASIEGYTFCRGGRRLVVSQGAGFDREDLVRMWPHVLAAARVNGAMVGARLERIAAGEAVGGPEGRAVEEDRPDDAAPARA